MASDKKKIIYDIKPMSEKKGQAAGGRSRKKQTTRSRGKQSTGKRKTRTRETPRRQRSAHASSSESRHVNRGPMWVVAGAVLIGLFFTVSLFFSKASITITPQQESFSLTDVPVTAYKAADEDELSFELMSLSQKSTSTVSADAEVREVRREAEGTVTLINEDSQESINLLIETRLEDESGHIYKTTKATTIPGMTGDAPGTTTVSVRADEPGEAYNHTDPITLRIPGFSGSDRYETVYAESTGAIAGGHVGEEYVIADEVRTTAEEQISQTLRERLFREARAQVPDEFIFSEAGVLFSFEPLSVESVEGGEVTVSQAGRITAFLLSREEIAQYVARTQVSQYDDGDVYIPETVPIEFAIANRSLIDPQEVAAVDMTLTGEGTLYWRVDTEAVTDSLLGAKKHTFGGIMSTFPSVDSAEVSIRPFWRNQFPDEAERIDISVTAPDR